MDARTVAQFLRDGWGVAGFTGRYDGVSAVTVDGDGMVRSALPVDGGRFAMALEVGGRAMNLLFPYPGSCCAHGLVKDERAAGSDRSSTCGCGIDPIGPNPAREG